MSRKPLPRKLLPAIDFKASTNEIIIHSEICIKCGICINKCPKNAIYVKNLVEEKESEQRIHLYPSKDADQEGFRLYNFPTLVPGRVTGLCGPNGIGKSTILNILSLNMKPNFGNLNMDISKKSWKELASNVRDSNVRNHFIEAESGSRKISYKKQVLKILFEEFKGQRVIEILDRCQNVDPEFRKLIYDSLDIPIIANRYLEECSGGELQRFAISLVLMTDADLYLIDEPVTFLDVKKRIRLAELLQARATGINGKDPRAVVVVDHDLTILDYMSDVIHLFYGEPHKFGVITRVQPVKGGINSYLNGFLKTENLEFRPNRIEFRKTISGRTWSNAQIMAKWGEVRKNLGDFQLNIKPGILYQNEILGVVGENGLGKTTFFKILVGMLQPDYGEMNFSSRFGLSYKPQYITADFQGTVEQFISQFADKFIQTEDLIEKIYEPLGIVNLFSTNVSDLSGGQLQRMYIAACLSKDANLYLIDEPSAYLDVEERLKIAEIIRTHAKSTNASAICIEHDIQITDALADQLLIFLGEPGKIGYTEGPLSKRDGMNRFLKSLDITFRRDEETGRARINKRGSSLDQKQRSMGEYYYVKLHEHDPFSE